MKTHGHDHTLHDHTLHTHTLHDHTLHDHILHTHTLHDHALHDQQQDLDRVRVDAAELESLLDVAQSIVQKQEGDTDVHVPRREQHVPGHEQHVPGHR